MCKNLKASAIEHEANDKAFNHRARAEIKKRHASDSTDNKLNFDCFCLDIQLFIINYMQIT